jgi:hypothetical protein
MEGIDLTKVKYTHSKNTLNIDLNININNETLSIEILNINNERYIVGGIV